MRPSLQLCWSRSACLECSTGNVLTPAERDPAALLAEGLEALGRQLDPAQQRRLLELTRLLCVWALRFNLTSHRTPAAVISRLVLDALALEGLLPPADRIADLGSGAGFPGLPLAIVRPEIRFVLVEARERRHHFQRTVIRELGLENVEPRRGRIEQLEPWSAQGVVAQAVAKPRRAVELAIPWCEPGGWIAVPGSQSPPDPRALDAISIANTFAYQVPCGGPSRSLWLGRRA